MSPSAWRSRLELRLQPVRKHAKRKRPRKRGTPNDFLLAFRRSELTRLKAAQHANTEEVNID